MATTTEGSNDRLTNSFGLAQGHAFHLLQPFVLRDEYGVIKHYMYMMRNPWGAETYTGRWNDRDVLSWIPLFTKQAPIYPLAENAPNVNERVFSYQGDTIDRDGIFFIEHSDFVVAFYSLAVGHY